MRSQHLLLAVLLGALGCGVPDHSKENGEPCGDSDECKSGYCEVSGDNDPVCKDRCVDNGNACGPAGQGNGDCCSGYCGSNGTCELH